MLANTTAGGKQGVVDHRDNSVVPVKPEEYAHSVAWCGALDNAGNRVANTSDAQRCCIIQEEVKAHLMKSKSPLQAAHSQCT